MEVPKKAQQRCQALEVDQVYKYDVVSALTNAQARLAFGQLCKRDAAGAWKELDRIFRGKLKLEVIGETEQAEVDEKEEKYLPIGLVKVHGMEVYALLHSGTKPNFVSP